MANATSLLTRILDVWVSVEKSTQNIDDILTACSNKDLAFQLERDQSLLRLAVKHQNKAIVDFLWRRKMSFDDQLVVEEARTRGGAIWEEYFREDRKSRRVKKGNKSSRISRSASPPASQGNEKDWTKEAEKIMSNYQKFTDGMETTKKECVGLLKQAQSLAVQDKSFVVSDDLSGHWDVAIWDRRQQQSLLGLMLLTRMSCEPPEGSIYEAIKTGNRSAFYYLAIRTRNFSSTFCDSESLERFPELKRDIKGKKGASSFDLDVPEDFINSWERLSEWDRYETERKTISTIQEDGYCVEIQR